MTSLTTRLDAVDRGFLKRLEQQSDRRQPPIIKRSAMVPAPPLADRPEPPPVVLADSLPETLVDRLLRAVPGAWANLAERVEDARRSGAVVIAITGARRGEGRTTVVQCLSRALAQRGLRVECHDRAPVETDHSTALHDEGIVLVDAGVWFPSGPLRRAWLERQSLGCHAAIVVRRADQPECAARGVALAAVGLRVLGEIITMAAPTTHSIHVM